MRAKPWWIGLCELILNENIWPVEEPVWRIVEQGSTVYRYKRLTN